MLGDQTTNVFICYRRADGQATAGRLREGLPRHLHSADVFLDVASISPGQNWRAEIEEAARRASKVLVLITPFWAAEPERFADEDDVLRYEILSSLETPEKLVPVLVDDTQMPEARLFPAELRAFFDLNAIRLRNERFEDDLAALARDVFGVPVAGSRGSWLNRPLGAGLGALVGFVIGLLTLAAIQEAVKPQAPSEVLTPIGPFLLIGLAALIGGWIGTRRL